ncbi:MAG: hypothetical protein IJX17_02040 [Clostridia bacterium]|nr:hypothetical protein [Clostridia bacterium]
MAIVKLSKLKLYGLSEDKKLITDLIYKSNLVHIKKVEMVSGLTNFFNENKLLEYKNKLEKVQKVIEYYKNNLQNTDNNDILVKETEFVNFNKTNKNFIQKMEKFHEYLQIVDEKNNLINEIKKSNNLAEDNKNNLSDEKKNSLFIINCLLDNKDEITDFINSLNMSIYDVDEKKNIVIISVDSELELIKSKLEKLQIKFELNTSTVSEDVFNNYQNIIVNLKEKSQNSELEVNDENFKKLKICFDYITYKLQKIELDKDLGFTDKTFILEGYIENDKKQILEDLIKSKNLCVAYEFSKPTNNDKVPTKTKNKKFVKPFEFVTNMYSVPKYNEIDPNFLVGLFFSLFFGFIMADIGYGILLLGIGLFLVLKKGTGQGLKDLMKVVAIGGVFAIVFGLLFGSFLGYTHNDFSFIPKALFPDPSKNVMMYLIASVVIGAVQIMVGFALKGILLIRRRKFGEAICSAFAWDIFFIGAGIFALDLVKVTDGLMMIGLGIAIFGVATAVIGNIIINKGFDRLAKSFGSLYSILNLFSDLLSYTRLFGLMLSGVIIATIVNQLASGFFAVAWQIPFGILILLIGHAFNISMGALGAYIHDARLQYIEFFSRFYEGEGELFTPFGSNFSYIKLIEVED